MQPYFQAQVLEQKYDVNMEGRFVYMPRRLDLSCGIIRLVEVEVGVLSRQLHVSTSFPWRKSLISIE